MKEPTKEINEKDDTLIPIDQIPKIKRKRKQK
jgi:hypothetical protein